MTPGRTFLRENLFLVAAVSLPLIVVAFFLAASAIPRWLVPPPAYDLIVRADDFYTRANSRITVEFNVRNEKVEATFRFAPVGGYQPRTVLFLIDHTTMTVREIPIELPDNLVEGDPPRTLAVDALAGRQALAPPTAPDGYMVESRRQRGPGIVGDLFGMNRYDSGASMVNKGRVIPIVLPAPFQDNYSPVTTVAWLAPEARGTTDGPH